MGQFTQVPPATITRVLSTFDRQQLEGFVAVAIDLMNLADGDPDQEGDPFNEGEPAFDPASRAMVDVHVGTVVDGDEADAAWTERSNQSRVLRQRRDAGWSGCGSDEDTEQDIPPDSSGDEGEPDFRIRSPWTNAVYDPGCAISDPDYGAEDLGEREEF